MTRGRKTTNVNSEVVTPADAYQLLALDILATPLAIATGRVAATGDELSEAFEFLRSERCRLLCDCLRIDLADVIAKVQRKL